MVINIIFLLIIALSVIFWHVMIWGNVYDPHKPLFLILDTTNYRKQLKTTPKSFSENIRLENINI